MKLQFNEKEHAYWLDGRRCKGATTVAGIPDDKYKINQWRLRMAVTGMAQSQPLVERAAAHFDERDQLEKIAEEAIVVAKANENRDRGTAVHRITERIDSGLDWIETPLAQAVQIAWNKALDDAGLDIVPGLVERIVVYPQQLIAGTFDRICRRRSDGRHVMADLKTGPNVIRYPHSTAIQLALYANAPVLAGPIPAGGGTTYEFGELPADLDQETGYIIHMPAEDQAKVVPIDIAAGWEAAQQIVFPALTWRARNDLILEPVTVGEGTVPGPPPPPTARIEWCKAWVRAICDRGLKDDLQALWPEGVPTPRQGGWTDADITRIAIVCSNVDARDGKPLWPADPTVIPQTARARSKQHEQSISQ